MTVKDYKRQIKLSSILGEVLPEPYLSVYNFIDEVVENKEGKYYIIEGDCILFSREVDEKLRKIFSSEVRSNFIKSVLIFSKIAEKTGTNFKYYKLKDEELITKTI